MNVICEQFTSEKYLGENLDCSPVNVISIRYTAEPVVFCTGSHSNEIEVKFLLVTIGMPGFGGEEPSPANMEDKFCNCAKNAQLFKQLLALFWKRKTTPILIIQQFEKTFRTIHIQYNAGLLCHKLSYSVAGVTSQDEMTNSVKNTLLKQCTALEIMRITFTEFFPNKLKVDIIGNLKPQVGTYLTGFIFSQCNWFKKLNLV